jgi:nucleotide-binding universal stress UspA family protein
MTRRDIVSRRYFVSYTDSWRKRTFSDINLLNAEVCVLHHSPPGQFGETMSSCFGVARLPVGKSMKVTGTGVQAALRNILFATDFSSEAERAGRFAIGIAKHSSAKVLIVHVLDPSSVLYMPDAGIAVEMTFKDAEQRLAEADAQFRAEGIETEAVVSGATQTTKMLLALATERKVDLIAIGTKGLGTLGRLTLGSVAQQLIHEAEEPVLTVGPHVKAARAEHKFQRIVCATDFSEDATAAVEFAFSFTQKYSAHMYLCHVLPKPDGNRPLDTQELNEKFKAQLQQLIPTVARKWCDPECVLDHGYAVDGVLLLAKRVRADLIVLGTRRFSHWFDSFKAGIAFEVIRRADCPVLTVRK